MSDRSCAGALILSSVLALGPAVARAQAAAPASTQPADDTLTLTFPENTRIKVLIDYAAERLGLQFLYDDQIAQQVVTIKQGVKIPRGSLMNFLQMILQSKGYTIADLNQPGWKQIAPAASMAFNARPVAATTTRPAEGAVTQVFVTQVVDAARMEALLKPFLSQPGGSSASLAEQRLLIVTDYASNVARIGQLVKAMDTPTREVVTEFVSLEHGDAQEVSAKVATIMQATINTAGVQNPMQIGTVEVGFDARTNQVALVGAKERVAEARKVVKQFDTPVTLTTKTYQFDYASPERVDKLMKQMLDPAVQKRAYQAGVDKEARLLVVTATPEIHARIEAMKKSVDVAVAITDSPIQFYKLSNTSAKDVVQTLQSLQGNGGGGGSESAGLIEDNRGSANPMSRRRVNSAYGQGADQSTTSAKRPKLGVGTPVGGGATSQPSSHTASDLTTDAGGRAGFQTDNATITADVNTNSIIVVAEPTVQKVYEQLIKTLDKRRPQVLIECTLVTLDTSRNFTFGVDIGVNGGSGSSQIITFSNFGVGVPQVVNGSATGRLLVPGQPGFNGALLSSDIADIVVNALLTTSRAKVVSAPRILVNDNATGSLMSIAEQPYTNTDIGNTISTTSFGGYAEAGTTIDLTPHISEANYLQLEYDVSLNQFSGQGSGGIPPPRQTNSLSSTVTIPDGSTIIIGGLDSSNFNETVNTIPVLGEIPVLKWFFGTTNRDRHDSTLFVFLRPIILRDDRFQDLKYLSERDTKLAGMSPDDPPSEPMVIQ
jgi:general secretion pathway protein D